MVYDTTRLRGFGKALWTISYLDRESGATVFQDPGDAWERTLEFNLNTEGQSLMNFKKTKCQPKADHSKPIPELGVVYLKNPSRQLRGLRDLHSDGWSI